MFIELTYLGETSAMNCNAIYEITENRIVFSNAGSRNDWFKCEESFDDIKDFLLQPGSKFILLTSNNRNRSKVLINIDHIKAITPKERATEVEMVWCRTTKHEYVIETYDEIMTKISNSGFVCLMKTHE